MKSRNTLLAPTVYVSPLGTAKVNEQGLFSLQRGEHVVRAMKGDQVLGEHRGKGNFSHWRDIGKLHESSGI